jgi:hypothetical protein
MLEIMGEMFFCIEPFSGEVLLHSCPCRPRRILHRFLRFGVVAACWFEACARTCSSNVGHTLK